MSLTNEQRIQIHNLLENRDKIVAALFNIEQILRKYFPEEFDIAYQHYIPQIMTALYSDNRWLQRGEHNMQSTIDRLLDKLSVSTKDNIQKYI
jgi:hypothetical protein